MPFNTRHIYIVNIKNKINIYVESHHDLSDLERKSLYYGRGDMHDFVKNELDRRSKKGIKSTSALTVDDEEDEDDSENNNF
jgi:hypothetical protein